MSAYTGPAFVKLNSWAGITKHRVKIVGMRHDGRFIAVWDDEPALRRRPGDKLYPPADCIEIAAPHREERSDE